MSNNRINQGLIRCNDTETTVEEQMIKTKANVTLGQLSSRKRYSHIAAPLLLGLYGFTVKGGGQHDPRNVLSVSSFCSFGCASSVHTSSTFHATFFCEGYILSDRHCECALTLGEEQKNLKERLEK